MQNITIDLERVFNFLWSAVGGAGGAYALIKFIIKNEAVSANASIITKLEEKVDKHKEELNDALKELPSLYVTKEMCNLKHVQMEDLKDKMNVLEERITHLSNEVASLGECITVSLNKLSETIQVISNKK